MFDVVDPVAGTLAKGVSRAEADAVKTTHPKAQVRTRAETKTVKAAYAVFVDGAQVGDPYTDPGKAAKEAKAVGGTIRLVPAA